MSEPIAQFLGGELPPDLTPEQIRALASALLDGAILPGHLLSLSDAAINTLVEFLKQEADRHWHINANHTLEYGNRIVEIGKVRNRPTYIALGTMTRSDALRMLGQLENAWAVMEEAGVRYEEAGDEVGWARTRIGRLAMCANLNRVSEALADFERAHAIFLACSEDSKRMRLLLNAGVLYSYHLGDQQQALIHYRSALALAETLDDKLVYRVLVFNIGLAFRHYGDLYQALSHYEQALTLALEAGEIALASMIRRNIAYIAQAQGHFRYALRLFNEAYEQLLPINRIEAVNTRRDIAECYLAVNRPAQACDLLQDILLDYQTLGATYEVARTYIQIATAEAALEQWDNAQIALDHAQATFESLKSPSWLAALRLRRGQIALKQANYTLVKRETQAAADHFEATGEQVNFASALLLSGQVAFAQHALDLAFSSGCVVLNIAQRNHMPALRYAAHLLLGHVAEAQGHHRRALRRYQAAISTIERVERALTITLRSDFLDDKAEGLRSLIALHLRLGHMAQAFEALERGKSQTWLSYLARREQFHWQAEDAESQRLIAELNQLRAEHQWYSQFTTTKPEIGGLDPQQATEEIARRERRIRAITEQLYLQREVEMGDRLPGVSAAQIQASIPPDALLIEYYSDGECLWAFTLDQTSLEVHALAMSMAEFKPLLGQFQFNIACALRAGVGNPLVDQLEKVTRKLAQRMYQGLLAPMQARLQGRKRLLIVPYNVLHYLPFHILNSGAGYLIEQYEIVVLPTASLATRPPVRRSGGALILAHSDDGHLPQTRDEAQLVGQMLSGEAYFDADAQRTQLKTPPRQVLHIAAHGKYRIDQPDLSYIQLADGQLYTDDLLQNDLSYELVTLSACETGRANVAGGDELIGLGRGFLYAGAGALIASLWRVDDALTVTFMERLYRGLRAGQSKATALRNAQLAAMQMQHPAFWGAFQLIGSADPLTIPPADAISPDLVPVRS